MRPSYLPLCLSANDLPSGRVVYLTRGDLWSPHLAEAVQFEDTASAEAGLALAQAHSNTVVGAMLVPLRENQPRAARDRIRATGPFSLPSHRSRPHA